jgi:hypothetical protein
MNTSKIPDVLKLVKEAGVFRARDLAPYGIPRAYLSRLCQAGKLQRLGRGLYMLANSEIRTNHSLAEAAKRVPQGVIACSPHCAFMECPLRHPSKYGWRLITKPAHQLLKKRLCVL